MNMMTKYNGIYYNKENWKYTAIILMDNQVIYEETFSDELTAVLSRKMFIVKFLSKKMREKIRW